jgi:hypothetical protein
MKQKQQMHHLLHKTRLQFAQNLSMADTKFLGLEGYNHATSNFTDHNVTFHNGSKLSDVFDEELSTIASSVTQ